MPSSKLRELLVDFGERRKLGSFHHVHQVVHQKVGQALSLHGDAGFVASECVDGAEAPRGRAHRKEAAAVVRPARESRRGDPVHQVGVWFTDDNLVKLWWVGAAVKIEVSFDAVGEHDPNPVAHLVLAVRAHDTVLTRGCAHDPLAERADEPDGELLEASRFIPVRVRVGEGWNGRGRVERDASRVMSFGAGDG